MGVVPTSSVARLGSEHPCVDGLVQELVTFSQMRSTCLPWPERWGAGEGRRLNKLVDSHHVGIRFGNRYSLLGWSLGGQIALDLAAAMPGQI